MVFAELGGSGGDSIALDPTQQVYRVVTLRGGKLRAELQPSKLADAVTVFVVAHRCPPKP